jgi:hypothetical protein
MEEEWCCLRVPGIIEAAMAIIPKADGRVSIRVVIGAGSGRSSRCDLVELIISPEHVECALAAMMVRAMAGPENADELPTVPCHIGFYRNAVHRAA